MSDKIKIISTSQKNLINPSQYKKYINININSKKLIKNNYKVFTENNIGQVVLTDFYKYYKNELTEISESFDSGEYNELLDSFSDIISENERDFFLVFKNINEQSNNLDKIISAVNTSKVISKYSSETTPFEKLEKIVNGVSHFFSKLKRYELLPMEIWQIIKYERIERDISWPVFKQVDITQYSDEGSYQKYKEIPQMAYEN